MQGLPSVGLYMLHYMLLHAACSIPALANVAPHLTSVFLGGVPRLATRYEQLVLRAAGRKLCCTVCYLLSACTASNAKSEGSLLEKNAHLDLAALSCSEHVLCENIHCASL